MDPATWKRYVETLCKDAWDFDAAATDDLVEKIEDLIRDGPMTDSALAELLMSSGVSETSADLIAPSIRVSIRA